jgi:hypothetical protein
MSSHPDSGEAARNFIDSNFQYVPLSEYQKIKARAEGHEKDNFPSWERDFIGAHPEPSASASVAHGGAGSVDAVSPTSSLPDNRLARDPAQRHRDVMWYGAGAGLSGLGTAILAQRAWRNYNNWQRLRRLRRQAARSERQRVEYESMRKHLEGSGWRTAGYGLSTVLAALLTKRLGSRAWQAHKQRAAA